MLMGLGPFRFTVPSFSIEGLSRRSSNRIAFQPVIGAKPVMHRLGPGTGEVTLSSTFHPMHMNKGGEVLLAALHLVCDAESPLMLISMTGFVFGEWVITNVSGEHTVFAYGGVAQTVAAEIQLKEVGRNAGGGLSVGGLRLF